MQTLNIGTNGKTALVDITEQVQRAVSEAGFEAGVCMLFVPHTTAGITLNENWDPDVRHDILLKVDELIRQDARFKHGEGNSPAHIKASLFGSSALVFIEGGKLQLGSWQGVYLAEFDGPRRRKVWLRLLAAV